MALTDKLTAIANAIREKTGGTELLTLDQMPAEIAGIETGGGDIVHGTFSISSETTEFTLEHGLSAKPSGFIIIAPAVSAGFGLKALVYAASDTTSNRERYAYTTSSAPSSSEDYSYGFRSNNHLKDVGITVDDVAIKFNMTEKNIYLWYARTYIWIAWR